MLPFIRIWGSSKNRILSRLVRKVGAARIKLRLSNCKGLNTRLMKPSPWTSTDTTIIWVKVSQMWASNQVETRLELLAETIMGKWMTYWSSQSWSKRTEEHTKRHQKVYPNHIRNIRGDSISIKAYPSKLLRKTWFRHRRILIRLHKESLWQYPAIERQTTR